VAIGSYAARVAAIAVAASVAGVACHHAPSTSTSAALRPYPGGIQGTITDWRNDKLLGVTIVATSGSILRTAITDDNGHYELAKLPAGEYVVTAYYANATKRVRAIKVTDAKITPVFMTMNTDPRRQAAYSWCDDFGHVVGDICYF
jgi:hypothetical protein